ncbi:hypothetical protein AWJ20_3778 [Sugiyamaella lignohabitans]|uniref:UmuC domain-containing protein n=1 Tax=Sugiyamaella lignohabitans TaxID=796027 RepID=A0A167BYI6_9ASCO|nr:uncharacterized protein AWJ20_3778 [Sugiyamaella lignohabitans]ANB10984.1 hypothetical protein AWJ20_3778 [Sugiyamaella lignohabitans]
MSKVVISLDLDAFYCAVEQHYDPTLAGDVPFIVYQKNCVATLSYAARNLGLKKLSTVSEAVKKVPGIRLVNGESLAKYRAEGKKILDFVSGLFGGCVPMERLGLEELRIDITKVVDYNMENLRNTGLLDIIRNSGAEVGDESPEGIYLFMTDGDTPTNDSGISGRRVIGGGGGLDGSEADIDKTPSSDPFFCENFFFNVPAKVFPLDRNNALPTFTDSEEHLRCYIGGQLASYIMERLSMDMGYNCSIGLGPNKTIAKMACSLNKPKGLTIVLPEHVQDYLDSTFVSAIPGFGHKTVRRIAEDIAFSDRPGNGLFSTFKRENENPTSAAPIRDSRTPTPDSPLATNSNEAKLSSVEVSPPTLQKPVSIEASPSSNKPVSVETSPSSKKPISTIKSSGGVEKLELHALMDREFGRHLTVYDVRTNLHRTDFVRLFGQKQGSVLWDLMHGIDNSPVKQASDIPTQISIEDTYKRIDTFELVKEAIVSLTNSLLYQIHCDLIDSGDLTWRVFPTTFRLTMSRGDFNPYAVRKSKSTRLPPSFFDEMLSISSTPDPTPLSYEVLSRKLFQDPILALYNQLSTARAGEKLNVRLLNVAVTNFDPTRPTATRSKPSSRQSRGVMDRFLNLK